MIGYVDLDVPVGSPPDRGVRAPAGGDPGEPDGDPGVAPGDRRQ